MGVRVVLADDHAVVRRGTRDILEADPNIEVVGEAVDGSEAVSLTETLQPDVAVLDFEMPGLNGIETARRIGEESPGTAILILSVHDEEPYVVEAIRAGVSGYLLKHARESEIRSAVLEIAAGRHVLDPSLTSRVMSLVAQTSVEQSPLTDRQLEVLRLAADGRSNRQIADALGLSDRTVEVHLGRVFRALGVASRTEAVTVALRDGLITLDPGAR